MKSNSTRNLQFGFGLSLLLLIISTVLSFISIHNLLQSANLVDRSDKVVSSLENVMSIVKDAETGQRGYLLTNKDEFLAPYNGAYDRAIVLLNNVQEMTSGDAVQQANISHVRDAILKRLTVLQQMLDKKRGGETVTVEDFRAGKAAMDGLRKVISQTETQERKLLGERTVALRNISNYTPLIIAFAALLAIAISIFSYLKITQDMTDKDRLRQDLEDKDREISRRINLIQHVAEQIAQGDYTVRIDDSGEDDLGSLALAINKMEVSLEDSFNRLSDNEWMQTGMAELNNHMIGEKDVSSLTLDIIAFLSGYTESQSGALYLLESDVLNLESGFALNGSPRQFRLGEGLIGQAARNNQEVWLKEMDEKDIIVSHATGAIRAKNVMIVPIHHEKRVTGVIELASIYSYSERILHFVRNVSANIGIEINSAQNRRQRQELLEETQAQTEELQAQHHELESLNTELETHTKKLQASEEELRAQQEELLKTNSELERRNELINNRNTEIRQKAEELEQSTRYKSEFMANMSHELRTPLNSILLLSRYLSENSEQNLNPDQLESASIILNSGKGLLDLIDELLDLSKIEAGKMQLEYQQVFLEDIINSMHALFEPIAKERNLTLHFQKEPTGLTSIITDRMRLEQILKNLLSNALKFTSQGEVRMVLSKDASQPGYINFEVSDTGIGIPEDKQGSIFDAFQQADGSTKRKFGGTGLGLSISRKLARLLGGEISLSSEPGKGSAFTVMVPVNKKAVAGIQPAFPPTEISEQPLPPAPAPSKYIVSRIPSDVSDDRDALKTGDKIVLIIEDDTAFAKALLGFTRKSGYKGIVAVRGDQGVALARQYKPVAILLDILLPVKDGWEVLDELKADHATRHIPVHIMSSLEAKRESRMKGAADFIHKPIAIEQMKEMFKKLEDAMSRSPKKVLIVEENTKHAEALAFFLETFNVTSTISGSVVSSVEALQNKEVDCVIMDMGIPAKNAYETLETIKRNPGLEELPIIVFTGKSLSAAEESRIKQYADTIVIKTAHSYQRILDEVALFLHLIGETDQNGTARSAQHKSRLNEILKDKTVLIADDDARNIFSITKYLEKHNMKVVSATDGRKALERLEQHPETAVVLMDMMMPDMDGYESTAKIRKHPRFKNLPIIAVTAKAMMGDREKCIAAGASDYISKPVDIDQLVSLLRIWLF
jgi:signal transduction histidine kinase/DNA-binding response OmpR family regulator/CHASE3 domain sensor protein